MGRRNNEIIELLEEADGTYSVLNPNQLIEGFVYVAKGEIH